MRPELTSMALARESNRYLLIRLMAKATRKLHRPKTRLQDTMNAAFERFGCSKKEQPTVLRKGQQVGEPFA
jgi:hypothetical protein